ncbi:MULTISPECIES: C2 family cysteine protease [unclassified Kribbella]|uniref:C2 family cysteine protease n=1 Tax=unclassified Kribbella TaxID=2644121 RepID=UPI0030178EAD
MNTYVGFDLPRVRGLANDLRKVAGASSRLHSDVKKVLDDAASHLNGKPVTNSDQLAAVQLGSIGFFGGITFAPPGNLAGPLEDMAGSIDRRANHLEKCKELQDACKGTVDPSLVFVDEPPPDPEKVNEALEALRDMQDKDTGMNGNRDDLQSVADKLKGLTSAELDMFLNAAKPEELESLRKQMEATGSAGFLWMGDNGLPVGERIEFASALLAKASPENQEKLLAAFPWLQPGFDSTDVYLDKFNDQTGKATNGMHYGLPSDPLFTNKPLGEDVYQGQMGDCWYIASLTATAQRDPDFIREGIKENPNGTISVRVWDADGNQRWVTMNRELPLDENGNPVGAHGDGSTWAAYYEKAFAIAYEGDEGGAPDGKEGNDAYDKSEQGTYGAIEWDYTEQAPPYVTGQDSEGIGTNYDDVKEAYDSGHPVIVASNSDKDGVPDNWSQEQKDAYVTRHVYYVKEFTPDGKIVLGNPWGPDSPTVTVTQDEFEDMFDDAQSLQIKGN